MKVPVHLNALRAFEASARHQSFSLAAEELKMSPRRLWVSWYAPLKKLLDFHCFIAAITGERPFC
ncbi:LysR family transcriptional regulator [Enterobacter hormaechei]|nr:LysR family transcriptional regulator [Enterobacter hormaechei]